MLSFKELGVMHFNIECDIFVAHRDLYQAATGFVEDAIEEDAGYEIASEMGWDEEQLRIFLLPYVYDDGYVVHRIGGCPDNDIDDWWEFMNNPGRGHIKVWYLDMAKVELPKNIR